jgi:hypothetical protein
MALQAFVGPWPLFQFLGLFTQSAELPRGGISQSQVRYLHAGQHKHRKSTQLSMPKVEFEPIIPAFEWAKTVYALDRADTVMGTLILT